MVEAIWGRISNLPIKFNITSWPSQFRKRFGSLCDRRMCGVFDRVYGPEVLAGQLFSLFVITVAAAEAVVGLALILAIYRTRGTVAVDDLRELRG